MYSRLKSIQQKIFLLLATLSGQWKARAMGLKIRLIRTRFPLEILFSYPVHVNGLKSPSVFLANISIRVYSTIHKDGIRTFSKILPMKMLVLNVFPLQRQLVKPNLMITFTCICQSPLARYSTHTVLYYKYYYILMRKILTGTIVPSSIAK